ncbi:MAG: ferredoxin--NADP reductase [Oceanicaulis sp.]
MLDQPANIQHRDAQPDVVDEGAFFSCRVSEVQHYTDTLFRFRTARPASLRFRPGEFVMIGLPGETKPVLRAYSVASPSWDDTLEFYSIKVEGGALTSRLRHIKPGDRVLVGRKPTGTLVTDALKPGKRLYMLSTGTGAAPFASLIREPSLYEQFDEVILTHTCRTHAELAYTRELVEAVKADPLVGELAAERLTYFSSVTRETGPRTGRITTLIETGALFEAIGRPGLDRSVDRVMICGSMAMLEQLKAMLDARGFEEGANAKPGDYVVEKAFAGDGV